MKRLTSSILLASTLIILAGCSHSNESTTGSIDNAPTASSSSSVSSDTAAQSPTLSASQSNDQTLNDIDQVMTGLMSSTKTLPDGMKLGPNLSAWLDRSDRDKVWVATRVANTDVDGNRYTFHLSLNSTLLQPGETIEEAGQRAYSYTRNNINNMQYVETKIVVVYDQSSHTLEKE